MTTGASLPARVLAHIRENRLFRDPGEALVAVSGGVDSVALLDLLRDTASELGLSLVVAHVDHGIQSDSRTVGRSVKTLAEKYGLPFESTELHLGPDTTETEARRARYAWLREVQKRRGAKYIVTAHHEDDQVETILLRGLRGSAPAGLAGISPRGRGGLVRPLLPFTRSELLAHVAERALPVYEDPANRDPRHLRSWVRTTLLPLLNERLGSRLRRDLLEQGRHAASDRRAWDHILDMVPELALTVQGTTVTVARASVSGYDNALSVALLRAAARRVGLVLGPTRARQLVVLAQRPSGRRLPLGDGWSPKWRSISCGSVATRTTRSIARSNESGRAASGARPGLADSKLPGRRRRLLRRSSARLGRPGWIAPRGKCGGPLAAIRWCRWAASDTGRSGGY